MGVFAGPEITESGLVLSLDAANNKSILSAVEVLVVAGGGGGGGSTAGGGGGGGVLYSSAVSITPGSAITATVGDGGAGTVRSGQGAPTNTSGGNSVFGALTAIGGGRGYSGSDAYTPRTSAVGGSGGGGGYYGGGLDPKGSGTSSAGTAGQGFGGGDGAAIGEWGGGGGGGAGGVGSPQVASNTLRTGGPGLGFNISGTFTYYAGGGGGGCYSNGFSLGGIGGGGNGGDGLYYTPTAGATNTGGGGGGGGYYQYGPGGGAGGSGIVIVRYPGSQRATGGTVTFVGGHTIHTFTTSGTFTPTWGDMSTNGNNGTLVNGVGYSASNGGSLVFDGVNDYVLISSSISYSEYTFMFFCRWISSVGVSERIFGSDGFGTYTIFNPSDVGFHYNPLGNSPPSVVFSSGVNIGFGTWCQVAVTVSTSNTLVRIYVNGVLRNSSSILPSQNLIGNLFIGSQNTLYRSNCNVSNFNLYNRALTAAEISQNFNALRGRFGI